MNDSKVIIMHGLSPDDAVIAMRAVKAALGGKNEIAFAASTPTNMEWKLCDIVEHVAEEHQLFLQQSKQSKPD